MLTSLIRRAPAALSWRAACRQARALIVCALLPLAACATHPPATSLDRPASHALPADTATPLRDALAAPAAAHPGQSGFRLLADGATALQMRIALARAATKTLDMQYYIATEDTTGKLLLAAALYAADRGVRVRMLVDDLNFKDIDRVMAALNTHPNIEIRVFNPFGASQRGVMERTANFFTRIDSFTRRMHNKAMIADNQLAIVGGRNLGDEYFSASPTLQFRDLDVLAAGPVTHDISKSFDDYWASASSYPLRALNHQTFDPKDLDAMRDELRDHWRKNADPYNAKPLNATPLARQIARDELELVWAPAEFKVDAPTKVAQPTGTYVSPPMQRLAELTRGAQKEFLAFSPYFVPHDAGVKILGDTAARGVRVAIVTNSLAATDAVAVQAGYAPYRVPLLQRGVELYEFKSQPDQQPARLFGSRSRASLHAKAYVIDRQILVIGSLNLDPRSAHLNTELALVIHSPVLAQQAAAIFARVTQPDESYRVTLATRTDGSPPALEWTGTEGGQLTTYHVDPHAGLLRNVMTGIFTLLPVDDQL
ncbi:MULTISPECIES: phospholipase D family protein [unclassified Burkholderia]|uniref:phospholipase D family protein n=1 Tax=unclassified Burkholderia TaxID=2613784 RepID=UPI0007534D03|nr:MULTISPECIES: phospholipase D family protein [unclassified Burkholderia]AOI79647.1 phospholipase [Burkholderia sp. NRF60-BP8]KVA15005.1 phospholipase [Burkholderia sp. NRF60-BP8]KVL20601.1 phospholipase [Burkholderia sp. MSMB1826]